jgi:hypothetical protein
MDHVLVSFKTKRLSALAGENSGGGHLGTKDHDELESDSQDELERRDRSTDASHTDDEGREAEVAHATQTLSITHYDSPYSYCDAELSGGGTVRCRRTGNWYPAWVPEMHLADL